MPLYHTSKVMPFLVSCLMITQKGRAAFVAAAIDQFRAQTYEHRELVIVTNAPAELPPIDDPRIKVYPYPEAFKRLSIGALRNCSIAHATGDAFATWDDDDIRVPEYLASQVACLSLAPLVVLPYVQVRCVCGVTVRINNMRNQASMVIMRSLMVPYPDQDGGEDTALFKAIAKSHRKVAHNNVPSLYTKVFHGNNVSEHAPLFHMATPPHTCPALHDEAWGVYKNKRHERTRTHQGCLIVPGRFGNYYIYTADCSYLTSAPTVVAAEAWIDDRVWRADQPLSD